MTGFGTRKWALWRGLVKSLSVWEKLFIFEETVVEGLESEENLTGSWRKGNLCYEVAGLATLLPEVM